MQQQGGWLIHGGTVVDGTGAKAYRGDVRVRGSKITEIGENLSPRDGEAIYDAEGCYVSPGFIESHTHLDGVMWWQSDLKPLPGNGVTTAIAGNCGFALAPTNKDPKVRDEIVKIFSFFEDFPEAPFHTHLSWDWEKWSEYKKSVEDNVKTPINHASFVGHIALRLAVMGLEAWERAATKPEIEKMQALLVDALEAGALGMSVNFLDHDGQDRAVPSMLADDDELTALFKVVSQYKNATVQVVIDFLMRMTAVPTMERMARLCEGLPIRMNWAGVPTIQWTKDLGLQQPLKEMHKKFVAEGRDFWTAFMHVPITTTASIQSSLMFAQSNEYVWHEVVTAATDAEKLKLLKDPEWRKRARHSWDNDSIEISFFRKPEGTMLDNSDNGHGPLGITLGEYAKELGVHCSDALAEWFVQNGVSSTVTMPPWETDEETIIELLKDPMTVGNLNDVGAHGQMFCGAGYSLLLLTHFVRDTKALTIEESVHAQTGKLANHFGISGRGEIAVGNYADITVFNLDEIEMRPQIKTVDVPNGKGGNTWRWTRDPAPVRLTINNGQPTFMDGEHTEYRPGEFLSVA